MEAPTTKEADVEDREEKISEMCGYLLWDADVGTTQLSGFLQAIEAAAMIARELYPKGVDDAGQGQPGHQPQVGDKAPDR